MIGSRLFWSSSLKANGLARFTYSQLRQMTNEFKEKVGIYGTVYRGHLLDDSREVAVKVLHGYYAPELVANERDLLGRISHNNLVSLLGYCEESALALIYEFMDNGDLTARLSDSTDLLSWKKRLEIAIDTAEGLLYLHKQCRPPTFHGNLKPSNILLNKELKAKIANFGLCRLFLDEHDISGKFVSYPSYTNPEFLKTGLLCEKVDIYSFGVVLMELITGKSLYSSFNFVNCFNDMVNGDIEKILDPRLAKEVSHSSVMKVTELALSCVVLHLESRPDILKVVSDLKDCLDMQIKKDAGL